jgi:hypothetical protein
VHWSTPGMDEAGAGHRRHAEGSIAWEVSEGPHAIVGMGYQEVGLSIAGEDKPSWDTRSLDPRIPPARRVGGDRLRAHQLPRRRRPVVYDFRVKQYASIVAAGHDGPTVVKDGKIVFDGTEATEPGSTSSASSASGNEQPYRR